MDSSLQRLQRRFDRARAENEALVLATVIGTQGSTYRKAGAQILIAADQSWEGLLSGGCFESDLAERAITVFETGVPKTISYAHAGDANSPWGLELGCEGSMDIWLMRIDAANGWDPFGKLMSHLADREPPTWGLVLESEVPSLRQGTSIWSPRDTEALPTGIPGDVASWVDRQLAQRREDAVIVEMIVPRLRLFVATPPPLRNVLVVGGGPDAQPLVDIGAMMGWRMTVVDHRPQYSRPDRWPRAHRVLTARPEDYAHSLDLDTFDASVIMTHHMPTDAAALASLARAPIPYVGQLGPPSRRHQLLAGLGDTSKLLQGRLFAPVGLELGGRDPYSIALAIAAELQAFFHGRLGKGMADAQWSDRMLRKDI